MTKELDKDVHQSIVALCGIGDSALDKQDYVTSVGEYRKAWELIPEPQVDWNASTWVLTAIGDAYFQNGDFDYAIETLNYAMHCPNAIGNPFIHLRLGQCRLEEGSLDKAADELTRAYMGAGEEIFNAEDSKYFEFLRTKIEI